MTAPTEYPPMKIGTIVTVKVGAFRGMTGTVDSLRPGWWVPVTIEGKKMIYGRADLRPPKVWCLSVGPDGHMCSKPRGHRRPEHSARGARWTGGYKTPAHRVRPDDGYRSEGDHQSWMRT